ncbi:MAG: hypothetical protein ABJA84_11810 [Polaromonas sp.]
MAMQFSHWAELRKIIGMDSMALFETAWHELESASPFIRASILVL